MAWHARYMNDTAATFGTPELDRHPAVHLAVVRETVAFSAIPALYDRAYPLIFAALQRAGVTPTAPPMGVVHGSPSDTLDLSVAVPVPAPFESSGDVVGETLPAARVATLLVRGDYGLLAAAYEHLYEWLSREGHVPAPIAWEQYLTEPMPDGDSALNETLIAVHLAEVRSR